jgi:hypothetical protein
MHKSEKTLRCASTVTVWVLQLEVQINAFDLMSLA